jgi:Tol biopolymer transport system component
MKTDSRTRLYGNLAIWGLVILSLTGFYSCKTTYQITSGSEDLRALTKVTDKEGVIGEEVSGGYGSDILLLTLYSPSSEARNIYKKDHSYSQAMAQITFGSLDSNPAYCASTDKIAFSQYKGGQRDLYLVPAKGSYLIPVTETPNDNEYSPSFSKDGVFLAYQKCKGGINDMSSEIWVKNLTTGENMLLGNGFSPQISPDGKKIAFSKCESSSIRHIWVMDIDGGNAMQLTNSAKEFAGFPCWSPNGEHIVFQDIINSKKSDYDLYIISKDGTGLMQITTNNSDDFGPFWGADNSIYFTSDRGSTKGKYQIWKFKPLEY